MTPNLETTSNPSSSSSKETESAQQGELPSGFVIEEIIDDTEAESGDIKKQTIKRPQRNLFPITRDWNKQVPKVPKMESQTASIPSLFTTLPPIRDLLQTDTSLIQDETVQTCLPFLSNPLSCNSHGIPHLRREAHIKFLKKGLEPLPAGYVTADASRPWMLYWALCGLTTMGEDVSSYRERVIATVRTMQNPTGGFGGGHGQFSHLAPSYAVILSLGIVGCSGNDEVLRETMSVVDRRGMWEWLWRLKCPDGGFRMGEGGEEDVRGAYCASVIITLLSLPLSMPPASAKTASPTSPIPPATLPPSIKLLTDLLPDYVSKCQTYEGGISGCPDVEAHGAYAFCALACLSILFPPQEIVSRQILNIPKLINWLSARQYSPEGGFAGRTNKLVDGCYSHWVGGCWPIIEAALSEKEGKPRGVLYSREALIRYIMCCCQDLSKRGGLRDKPGKFSDSYHSCYVLAGLSSAMWQNSYSSGEEDTSKPDHPLKGTNDNDLTAPYSWTGTPYIWEGTESATESNKVAVDEVQVFDDEDRVEWIHPVFVVPKGVAERVRVCFMGTKDEWALRGEDEE